jgi:hypothetical protein
VEETAPAGPDGRGRGTAERALLLLDVDGVLCPFEGAVPSTRRVGPRGYEQVALPSGMHEEFLWISPANARRLRRLQERFDIVWATGWGQRANAVIGPLHQLDELPVIELEDSGEPTWKLASVSAYVGAERACAWIDDDLGPDAVEWAERRAGPTLLVRAEPHEGLTDEMVERCLRFVARAPAGSPDPSGRPA